MTDQNVRPDLAKQVRALQRQIAELQRRRMPAFGGLGTPIVTFSYPGALANGVTSPKWWMEGSVITLTQARVSLNANASSDHVLWLLKDGTLTDTLTLPTGEHTIIIPIGLEVRSQSYLQIATVTVANSNLSVILASQ